MPPYVFRLGSAAVSVESAESGLFTTTPYFPSIYFRGLYFQLCKHLPIIFCHLKHLYISIIYFKLLMCPIRHLSPFFISPLLVRLFSLNDSKCLCMVIGWFMHGYKHTPYTKPVIHYLFLLVDKTIYV